MSTKLDWTELEVRNSVQEQPESVSLKTILMDPNDTILDACLKRDIANPEEPFVLFEHELLHDGEVVDVKDVNWNTFFPELWKYREALYRRLFVVTITVDVDFSLFERDAYLVYNDDVYCTDTDALLVWDYVTGVLESSTEYDRYGVSIVNVSPHAM